jgi:outer membrane protein assembly factor BamA
MRTGKASRFGPLAPIGLIVLILLAACAALNSAYAQDTNPAQVPSTAGKRPILFGTNADLQDSGKEKGEDVGLVDAEKDKSGEKKKRGEFAVAPIPMVNPSIGNGGGAAVLYARKFGDDPKVPASSFGAAGFYTENGSWMLGAGVRLYLANDRYRITGAAGGGEFNYNFFGIGSDAGQAGTSIPLAQRSRAFLIEPKIRILPYTYIGPRYHRITNRTSLNGDIDPGTLPIPLPEDLKFNTAALGLRGQRDTSDNPFYATVGSVIDLTMDFFGPGVGGDRTYQNGTLVFNKYFLAAKKNVFALHASGCTASEETPFFDVCQLGFPKDLRGYQIGQYRDYRMMVGQAEYRRELPWRLGAAAFAGAGSVGRTFGDMGSPEPGGGFGLRFLLAKENHINLRFDYAWGNNSHAFYVSLGEAF